jgi:hypothetical protein
MVATMITVMAQKETAKHALLAQLREAGATNAAMPASLDAESGHAKAALADLLAAGTVKEARPGLYFAEEALARSARPGSGFVALLAILVIISITASVIALAMVG